MRFPAIGDQLESTDGLRYRVTGVQLYPGWDADRPHIIGLTVELEPVAVRPPVPFREAVPPDPGKPEASGG